MEKILFLLGGVVLVSLLISVLLTARKAISKTMRVFSWFTTVLQVLIFVAVLVVARDTVATGAPQDQLFVPEQTGAVVNTESTQAPETMEATEPPTTVPPDPRLFFSPAKTENSDPDLFQLTWEIAVGDEIVAATGKDGFKAYPVTERVQKVQRYSFQRTFVETYQLSEGAFDYEVNPNTTAAPVEVEPAVAGHFLYRDIPMGEEE